MKLTKHSNHSRYIYQCLQTYDQNILSLFSYDLYQFLSYIFRCFCVYTFQYVVIISHHHHEFSETIGKSK
jgi:hypothetical protein